MVLGDNHSHWFSNVKVCCLMLLCRTVGFSMDTYWSSLARIIVFIMILLHYNARKCIQNSPRGELFFVFVCCIHVAHMELIHTVCKAISGLDGTAKWTEPARLLSCHCHVCPYSIWFPSGWYIGHVQIETENISALLGTYPSSGFSPGAQLKMKNDRNGIQNILSNSSDL